MSAETKGSEKGGNSEKPHPLLVAVIAGIFTILAAFIPVYFTVIQPKLAGASQPFLQLKSSYHGPAMGITNDSPNGTVTFTLKSEDAQGNVNILANFMITSSGKQDNYSCQGQVTTDKRITLHCYDIEVPSYIEDIRGNIFPDGHMEGSWIATDTVDSSYLHTYKWKVY